VTILSYSRTRLQIGAALFSFSMLMVVLRFWVQDSIVPDRGPNPFATIQTDIILPIAMLIPIAMLGRLFYLMCGDLAAIRALPEGLQVTGFLGRRLLPWEGVLGGHRVNYGNFMHRNRWFNIRYFVDGSNRAVRVPLILTKRPSGGQMSLSEKIDRAREDALGRPYKPSGERIEGTGIDHDAAIARYLEAKAREAELGVPVAAPSAVPHAAAPALPPVPSRPAFGRKGLG
jgi:hypothetical protein